MLGLSSMSDFQRGFEQVADGVTVRKESLDHVHEPVLLLVLQYVPEKLQVGSVAHAQRQQPLHKLYIHTPLDIWDLVKCPRGDLYTQSAGLLSERICLAFQYLVDLSEEEVHLVEVLAHHVPVRELGSPLER